jgi:hypothetical protein
MRSTCRPTGGGSTSTRTLMPDLRPVADAFIRFLRSQGVNVIVTSTRRSYDTQRRLWENFQAGCSRYPAAPPGRSRHGLGRAFDLNLSPPVYEAAGMVWEQLGGRWGGRFADRIHFEV